MRVVLASVSPRRTKGKSAGAEALADDYLARLKPTWLKVAAEVFPDEPALLRAHTSATRQPGGARLILLDPDARSLASDDFAAWLNRARESVTALWLAIGPADGWSAQARQQASEQLSLGPMTLPHELARAVLAEQLYRAWAILERHPYHRGH